MPQSPRLKRNLKEGLKSLKRCVLALCNKDNHDDAGVKLPLNFLNITALFNGVESNPRLRRSVNQSDAKLKPITTLWPAFSARLRQIDCV